MQASILIAAHDEGDWLRKTVRCCVDAASAGDYEIVVADDASVDGSVDRVQQEYPAVRIVRHQRQEGVSPTKDLAARHARGDVLVFLDAHCHPEPGAIDRLVADVEALSGSAVVAPRVATLDGSAWSNSRTTCGNGYLLELETFDQRWVPLTELRRRGPFFESPNLIGCCLAVSRGLYERLGGFDRDMLGWGMEQVDFGLKAWLLGYRVLNDVEAVIGHRFQPMEDIGVSKPQVMANELRTARKHFTEPVWSDWLSRFRSRQSPQVWVEAWRIFNSRRESVERERERLMVQRVRDEFWYAYEFGMDWPLSLLDGPALRELTENSNGASTQLDAAHVTGSAVGENGAWVTILLKLGRRPWGDLDIERVAYVCDGGGDVAGCACLLMHAVEGRTLENARALKEDYLVRRFPLRPADQSAAALAVGALNDALKNVDNLLARG